MKPVFFIWFVLYCGSGRAQEVPANTEQQLENLAAETIEDDGLLQQLSFLQKNPLNLNSATADDLRLLRFLTDLQIQSLLQYRTVFGKLLSVYELQAVPNLDLPTIHRILPYVFVGDATTVQESLKMRLQSGSRFFLTRINRVLEKAKGYDTTVKTHYLGDRNAVQARYVYQYKNLLYYGLVADKDAGEPFFKEGQKKGFDFYSIHFFARNLGRLKAVALGDYSLNLGQGLLHWQSLAFGKSAEVMNSKRQAPVLLPYRSAGEFYFNRGAAATLQAGRWQATAFVSLKKISGNLDADSATRFTSFGTSGFYRTRLEIADRYRLHHFSTGGNLSYNHKALHVGFNAITHSFSLPLQREAEPYNQFALRGKGFSLASIDYSYTHQNAHFFGEVAMDKQFHRAVVQGALVSVDEKMDVSLFYRNISKAFQSPFGNAFTENTTPTNENGFFTGIQLRPGYGWQLAAYADFFRFPFLKFRVSAPSRGWDYLAQVTYVPKRHTELYLRYRNENKQANNSGQAINFPENGLRRSVRFHVATQLNKQLSLKTRTEMVWFRKGTGDTEEGFLSYLEAAFEPTARLRGNGRLQYFETGGFDSRIYAFESDVLYSFSTPGFFDSGYRYYVNLSYSVTKQLAVWLRVAQTRYREKNTVGSGLDELDGNTRTDVRLQVRYVFK